VPENTLVAIRQAFANHASAVELDIRLSADGVPVLMHDSTLERTTDGAGLVSDQTVAQLKELDAGSWFGPEYAGERVPTLVEALQAARGKGLCYLDLKLTGLASALQAALLDADFPSSNVWFWVYNDENEAQAIRSVITDAHIVWGDPPSDWSTDAGFFQRMRDLGVFLFDLSAGSGNVDPIFVARAKAEGFRVSVYTVLAPDAMARAAANGVDFMETDYPAVLHELTPVPLAGASRPIPPPGSTNQPTSLRLSWLVGSNAVAHRLYFGTTTPPPFVGEQTSDLFLPDPLLTGTTYYWRVDEVKPGGVVTGAVWSFKTLGSPGLLNPRYEWTFDRANLAPALGNGVLAYADGAVTEALTSFGTTDGAAVPHIGGEPATYLHAPGLTGAANGYLASFLDSGPNGGGDYINQFTVLFDLLVPGDLAWTALFNTNPENGNDADFYVDASGRVGIGALAYSPPGTIQPNVWYRVAFAADLGAGAVSFYVDGAPVAQRTGGSLRDGRFSLYSRADALPSLLLFNEGDRTGTYTHELYLNSFAFTDRFMEAEEIQALGGPSASGIFVNELPPVKLTRSGPNVTLNWTASPTVKLQKASSLSPPEWRDVPNTLGADSYTEPAQGRAAYFRLVK
jgi:glycerophosphoryl diester phosphodiesterase